MTELEQRLRVRVEDGSKLLVPYVVGGSPSPESSVEAITTLSASADAIEIGLPYSDPVMDGPVIAAAAQRAIAAGMGPLAALALQAAVDIPRVAMTYYNPVHRLGEDVFCDRLVDARYAGLIVADLPHEESSSLRAACGARALAWIPLVTPTSPEERVETLVATATGFVYAVSTLGVTGVRESLSERAERVVTACRRHTDVPILVGIGVSTPEQAVQACEWADGVVIGTAAVRLLENEGIAAAADFLASVRDALDGLRVTSSPDVDPSDRFSGGRVAGQAE